MRDETASTTISKTHDPSSPCPSPSQPRFYPHSFARRALMASQVSKNSLQDSVLQMVTEFYLASRDFNGLPLQHIIDDSGIREDELKDVITALIKRGRVALYFGELHTNPHIKRLSELPKEKQVEALQKADLHHACAYPSRSHLRKSVKPSMYKGKPFALRLALGEPQLTFQAFDLRVLESYRNDPRYYYWTDDISGKISVRQRGRALRASDRVLLQTFGFAYDKKLRRAVAVFLRYLSGLSPEHQQIWQARALKGTYNLHPDYYRSAILGDWPEGISIFDALLEELHHVNRMCELIGRRPLFKSDFRGDNKPRGFGFLIRPTLKEFYDFVHLLDKVLSENISTDFFMGEVTSQTEHRRKDGKIEVRPKGSIRMLDEWIGLKFRIADRKPIDEAIATLRRVRKMRQKPAHAVDEDLFDHKYLKEQRELMKKAYNAARVLRLMFGNHPSTQECKEPDILDRGRIWTY